VARIDDDALASARLAFEGMLRIGRVLASVERRLGAGEMAVCAAERCGFNARQFDFYRRVFANREQLEAKFEDDPRALLDLIDEFDAIRAIR
jgi:hypothetical protein